jgi:polyhydroxyalkanoate synthesis repressor PhaR
VKQAPTPATAVAVIVIKRYENRKLYDPQARAYVTLADLSRMVAQGADIKVVDQKTGEDLTTLVLAQVVLEGVKERTADIPRHVLARLIRLAARPAAAWAEPAQEAAARARAEAERIAAGLIAKGRLTLDEALAVRQDIAGSVHRLVTDAQHGLESRFRGLFEGTDGPGQKLRTLEEKLDAFEQALAPPAARPRRKARAARRKS